MTQGYMASVVIITWNRKDVLLQVLTGLANQTVSLSAFEVLICDSYSLDGTAQMVQGFINSHPQMAIRHLHTINVISAKRNLGIKLAFADKIIFLDDDCVPQPSHLATMTNELEEFGPGHLICGEVRYPDAWVKTSNYFRFRDSRHFGSGRRLDLQGKHLDERTIVTMNMGAWRIDLLEKIGLFDESFTAYGCEDHEFGWRAMQKGCLICKGNASIIHFETSGTLDGYESKIVTTAKQGMATVAGRFPDLLARISPSFLEAPFDMSHTLFTRLLLRMFWSLVFAPPLVGLIRTTLAQTDSYHFFYSPVLYRYVTAAAYWYGARGRDSV